jgi:hypothetical protein
VEALDGVGLAHSDVETRILATASVAGAALSPASEAACDGHVLRCIVPPTVSADSFSSTVHRCMAMRAGIAT